MERPKSTSRKPKLVWDCDMIASLRTQRAAGVPLYVCAERIGVGYPEAVYKARELGLAQRMNRGRTRGEDIRHG